MTVKDIYDFIDSFAPFSTAAPWDNSGLLVGSAAASVTKAVVALDARMEEIEQAVRIGAELIITHHPVIFHAAKAFLTGDPAFEAAARNINILCAHTNLDKAPGGVNDSLCRQLGMDFRKEDDNIGEGFLNTGTLPIGGSSRETASYIASKLGASVRFSRPDSVPTRFAVCSGAGGDLAADAAAVGCDALITGDASYHDFLDAEQVGVTLFAAGHYETEVLILPVLTSRLSAAFPMIDFVPSVRTNPVITVR